MAQQAIQASPGNQIQEKIKDNHERHSNCLPGRQSNPQNPSNDIDNGLAGIRYRLHPLRIPV